MWELGLYWSADGMGLGQSEDKLELDVYQLLQWQLGSQQQAAFKRSRIRE